MSICAAPAHVHDSYLWVFFLGQASFFVCVVNNLLRKEAFSSFNVCLPGFQTALFSLYFPLIFFCSSLEMSVANEQLAIIWILMLAHAIFVLFYCWNYRFFPPFLLHFFPFLLWTWWNFSLFQRRRKNDMFFSAFFIVTVLQKSAICKFLLLQFDMQLNWKQKTIYIQNIFEVILCERQLSEKEICSQIELTHIKCDTNTSPM